MSAPGPNPLPQLTGEVATLAALEARHVLGRKGRRKPHSKPEANSLAFEAKYPPFGPRAG